VTEVVLLLVAVTLVVACGGFVAAEFALVAVDRASVDAAAAAGDRAAAGVQPALRSLSTQLSGAQVGITITSLAIGFLAEPAIANLIREPLAGLGVPASAVPGTAVALGMTVATIVTIVFGELVPKNIALARPFGTARATAGYQRAFTAVMKYPIRVLNGSANRLVRSMGVEPQEELRSARSPEELTSLVRRSAAEGTLDPGTARLLERSVAFSERVAGDVMTPRMQMVTIAATVAVADLVALAKSSGHSRFPVIDRGADDVIGAVHVKYAARVRVDRRSGTAVSAVMVPVTEVPITLPLDPLSDLLRGEGLQLAVAIDEYGGTAGLVTLEDAVEEIVGDIADEHDRLHDHLRGQVRARGNHTWSLSGRLRPDEVTRATGVPLPDDDDYDTIAGLLVSHLGRMPKAGDQVTIVLPDHCRPDATEARSHGPRLAVLTVEHMEGLRIDRVRLHVSDEPNTDDPNHARRGGDGARTGEGGDDE
jgi:magnesium and cobalt exporter, CNNM family